MGRHLFWRTALVLLLSLWAIGVTPIMAQRQRNSLEKPLSLPDINLIIEARWDESSLNFTVRQPLFFDRRSQPAQAYYQTQQFKQLLPLMIEEALGFIRFNDRELASERFFKDPQAPQAVARIAESATLLSSQYDPSFQYVVANYRLDLARHIGAYFVLHDRARELSRNYNWVAGDDYSGILISATEELPIRGSNRRGEAVAALSPRIYDDQLQPVAGFQNVAPEIIRHQGMVGYASASDVTYITERVGKNPLRIIAKELSGIALTDIIIDNQDAVRILSRRHNRQLVAQGKIVIVINGIHEEKQLTIGP